MVGKQKPKKTLELIPGSQERSKKKRGPYKKHVYGLDEIAQIDTKDLNVRQKKKERKRLLDLVLASVNYEEEADMHNFIANIKKKQ